eukprot:12346824-Heterocapsa_arctica.AAC.1
MHEQTCPHPAKEDPPDGGPAAGALHSLDVPAYLAPPPVRARSVRDARAPGTSEPRWGGLAGGAIRFHPARSSGRISPT